MKFPRFRDQNKGNAPAKKLVFHIGDAKTGSSSIQQVLFTGGYDCPTVKTAYPDSMAQIPLARSLYVPEEKSRAKNRFKATSSWVDKVDADLAVISAEHFENVPPETFKAALEKYFPDYAEEALVVAYVRPHADRFVSAFSQRTKTGLFFRQMDHFHKRMSDKGRFMYTPRFAAWRDAFGDRFILRPMIRSELHEGDVVKDFLHTILNGAPFELTGLGTANESPSLEELSVLRELNLAFKKRDLPHGVYHAASAHFSRVLPPPAIGETRTKLRLHRALAEDIVSTYRDDAQKLDAMFFPSGLMSKALEASVEKAVDTPMSTKAEAHFTPDSLRMIRAWSALTAQILTMEPEKWPQHFLGLRRRKLLEDAKAESGA
jgi:hypothetical protein